MSTPNSFLISNTHYSQPTSIKVRQKYGWTGYGIYIACMQLLATAPNRKIKLVEIPIIIYQLRLDNTNLAKDNAMSEFIDYCFTIDGDEFFSEDLENGLGQYNQKIANLNPSKAGKASAAKLSPEERIERARNAGMASAAKRNQQTNEETNQEINKKSNKEINEETN